MIGAPTCPSGIAAYPDAPALGDSEGQFVVVLEVGLIGQELAPLLGHARYDGGVRVLAGLIGHARKAHEVRPHALHELGKALLYLGRRLAHRRRQDLSTG